MEHILNQIEKVPIVKQYQGVFRKLCGFDFEIRTLDGNLIKGNPAQENPTTSAHMSNRLSGIDVFQEQPKHDQAPCKIKKEVIDNLVETKLPQTYLCPEGFKKVLVPLVLDNEVVGILVTGESHKGRFNGLQSGVLSGLLQQFMNYVIKNEINPLNIPMQSDTLTRQQEILIKAIKYIKENYRSNKLSLKEVCDNNGVSYHYLSRLFKQELNMSFSDFRNKVRMEVASKLLKVQRLSVGQVAFASGFDDPAYFCKVFKSHFGSSPQNFRFKNYTKKVTRLSKSRSRTLQALISA